MEMSESEKMYLITADAGRRAIATRILRYRRLWEVFLVKNLGLAATNAAALACRLADRLDDDLGHPQVSAPGKPIPRRASTPIP